MGPSGFQTKGLEYRGVVASLFFSCVVPCSVFHRDSSHLPWKNISEVFILLCGPILWNIPVGSVTVFQPDISRMIMEIPKFLVLQARWNNESR